jgi:hypothetical protein
MNHPLVGEILNEGIAGGRAQYREVIVVRGQRRVGRAAWHPLLVLIAIEVDRQQKLAFAAFATRAAGTLFATAERGQQHCRKDGDNRNHHQKLN